MSGLQKIILHNSYFTGKTVAIPCDGHTNNSGGNGAGKSSALNLIPIFYGEEPEKVNDKAAGKSSFIDFYLPASNSLIAFEYSREDGPRCAILYRHPSGKVAYRFINSEFQDAFFDAELKERLLKGLTIPEAINEIKTKGIGVSRQITNISEYRAIIQQNQKSIKKASTINKNIRAEAKEYCLGGASSQMMHMDRLTFSILKRNSMFKRLKNMIVDTMFGDINIEEKPNHDRNRYLIDEIRSVRKFSQNELDIRECIRLSNERLSVQLDMNKYARNLKSLTDIKSEEIEHKKQEEKRLLGKFESEETKYNNESIDLQNNLQTGEVKRIKISARIDDIYAQKEEWDTKNNIQVKITQHGNLDTFSNQMHAAEEHYNSLLQKVENIELEKKVRENDIERNYQEEQKRVSSQLSTFEKLKLTEQINLQEEIQGVNQRKQNELDVAKEVQFNELGNYQRLIERHQSTIDNISETAEEKAKLEFSQNSLDQVQNKINDLNSDIEKKTKIKSEIQKRLTESLASLSAKKNQLERHYSICDSLKNRLYPEDNSLLSELRKYDPNWGQTIGKIVSNELLNSKALSPSFSKEHIDTVYGWSLDLSKIPLPDCAESEDILKAKLEKEEERKEVCTSEISSIETISGKINKEISEASEEINHLNYKLSQLKDNLSTHALQRESLKNEIRDAILERKNIARKELDSVKKKIKLLEESYRLQISSINDRHSQLIQEANGRFAFLASDIEMKIESAKGLLGELDESRATKLRQLDEIYSNKYREQGVDDSQINETKNEHRRLKEKVLLIRGYIDEINAYSSWERQEWNALKSLENEEKELSKTCDDFNQKLKVLKENFKEKKDNHTKAIAIIQREIGDIKSLIEESVNLLKKVGTTSDGESFDESDIIFVQSKINSLMDTESILKSKILTSIHIAKRIITTAPESQIFKAWMQLEEIRARHSKYQVHEQAFLLQQPADLQTILDDSLPQIKKALIETVINIGGGINNYYLTLKQLTSQIKKVSSELEKKINTEQKIENLTDIRILLTSRIEEEECWSSLIRFNNEWDTWNLNREQDLPPESLINALKDALDTLSIARITNDIGSLVDLNLSMTENNRPVTIRSDSDFDKVSSNGLSYLAICVVFLGMSRYLCPDLSVKLTWPVDELAALSLKNVAKLFEMLDSANISMFSAFPSEDTNLLKFFKNKNLIDRTKGVRAIKVNEPLDKDALKNQILGLTSGANA